ncbi:MAG: insulinase family protein [Candidatus Bipolaricaulia bacterium]
MNRRHMSTCQVIAIATIALVVGASSLGMAQSSDVDQIDLPPTHRATLDNGLKVLVLEQHNLPIVQFNLRVGAGGSARDPDGKSGLASFTAQMLTEGTENRSGDEIAQQIDFVGGQLGASASSDHATVNARVLRDDFEVGLNLLADVAIDATFPESNMSTVRRQLVGNVKSAQDDPGSLVDRRFRNMLFGGDHPLGRASTESSINAISRSDLVKFHKTHYRPNVSTLVIAGDVTPSAIMPKVREAFGSWQRASVPELDLESPSTPKSNDALFVHKPGQTQVQIRLGEPGLAVSSDDYLAMQIANYVLGGGAFSSRLLQVVRSEAGQTYAISSQYASYEFPGYFQVSTFTRNNQLKDTLQLVMDELSKFRSEGLTEDELDAAKDHIAGSYVLGLETLSGLANEVQNAIAYDRGLDWIRNYKRTIRSFTLEEINQTIPKHLHPSSLQMALLGDFKTLAQLNKRTDQLVEGVALSDVNVVEWTQPLGAEPMSFTAYNDQRQQAQQPLTLEWNADVGEDARSVLENVIKAEGGADALESLTSYHAVGQGIVRQRGQTMSAQIETWVDPPLKVRQRTTISRGDQAIAVDYLWNGEQGWVGQGQNWRDMPADLTREMKVGMVFDPVFAPLFISREGYQFTHKGQVEIGDRKADVIQVTTPEGQSGKLYYDTEAHLLRRLERPEKAGQTRTTYYRDYRKVNGYMVPFFRETVVAGQTISRVQLQTVEINQELDPSLFQNPTN